MIVYVENPKQSTKKLLQLINAFKSHRIQDSHTDTHTHIIFLYTTNKHVGTKMKNNTIHNCSKKKKKYLSINLTEHVWHFYAKNYKMLMTGVKEYLNKLRNIPCLWIGDSI